MILSCPVCTARHIDVGEFATKAHHTHACQFCGIVWRPAIVNTVGVDFLPGFKNPPPAAPDLGSGCSHPEHCRLHGGYDGKVIPRYPLFYGSAEVEICSLCEMWRMNVHDPKRWRDGPYCDAYFERVREEADE